jgi:cytoskeletal protein CcmA (bactofilin family)
MLSRKNVEVKGSKTMTIIAEGVKVDGKIYSPGSTRVDGTVKGELAADKEVIIGKEGKVEADVKTKDAVIAGTFKGNMTASGEVEISSTGKFIGNLTQKDALLSVAKGGLFKGESIIGPEPDTPRTPEIKKEVKDVKL